MAALLSALSCNLPFSQKACCKCAVLETVRPVLSLMKSSLSSCLKSSIVSL